MDVLQLIDVSVLAVRKVQCQHGFRAQQTAETLSTISEFHVRRTAVRNAQTPDMQQVLLSYDQLRAALLIGRNAVT